MHHENIPNDFIEDFTGEEPEELDDDFENGYVTIYFFFAFLLEFIVDIVTT